jgi:hypothetical protein
MESLLDPPADLRCIIRPYLHASQAAVGESPSLALDALNTTKIPNGALALILNNNYSGVEDRGPKAQYIFKKFGTTALTSDDNVVPGLGGGVWVRMLDGNLLVSSQVLNNVPVTLTAGAGLTEVVISGVLGGQAPFLRYQLEAIASLRVTGGAVAGAVVAAQLQYSYQVGAPSWVDLGPIAPDFTLLADQQVDIALHARSILITAIEGATLLTRIVATDTVQTTTVPALGGNLLNNLFAYTIG